jgi:hypothetical protein
MAIRSPTKNTSAISLFDEARSKAKARNRPIIPFRKETW